MHLSRRLPIFLFAALFFLCSFHSSSLEAQATEIKSSTADIDAIKQVFQDFYTAFSRQDAHATTMTFATDGDFTNMFGIHVKGREAIEQRFTALFQGNLKGTSRRDTVRSIQFLAPNAAFVDADTVITGTKRPDGSIGPVRKGLMMAVMTKLDGKWYISNFHEAEYPNRVESTNPPAK